MLQRSREAFPLHHALMSSDLRKRPNSSSRLSQPLPLLARRHPQLLPLRAHPSQRLQQARRLSHLPFPGFLGFLGFSGFSVHLRVPHSLRSSPYFLSISHFIKTSSLPTTSTTVLSPFSANPRRVRPAPSTRRPTSSVPRSTRPSPTASLFRARRHTKSSRSSS